MFQPLATGLCCRVRRLYEALRGLFAAIGRRPRSLDCGISAGEQRCAGRRLLAAR